MTDAHYAENPKLETLHQLFASATHVAAGAMSRWTDGLITLTLDEVGEIPLEEVCTELDIGDELLTMVVMNLEGEVGGVMMLAFDESNARKLAASLLKREVNDEPQWSDLEKSALTETGNILGCAYMNALSELTNTKLMPGPPFFIQDYGASVLQQALATQAMTCDKVLICRTGFQRQGEELDWRVLFSPTKAMQDALVDVIDKTKDSDVKPVDCDSAIEDICRLLDVAEDQQQQSPQADAAPEIDDFEELDDETGIPAAYLSIFTDECEQSLESFTAALLALEGGGSHQELQELLVVPHRIKGSAASIGLNRPARLAHLMEDLLQNLLDTGGALSTQVTDAMLKCTDELRNYLQNMGSEDNQPDHFSELARELLTAQSPPNPSEAASNNNTAPEIDHFEGLEDETGISETYLSIFIDESEQSLESLTETLLALEGGGNHEELQKLLVVSHRIKGSAASVGLNRPAKLAHLMEDLLQSLLDIGGALSTQVADAMLKCTDELGNYLQGLRGGGNQSDRFSDLARELLTAQSTEAPSDETPSAEGQAEDQAEDQAAEPSEVREPAAQTPEAASGSPPADISEELRRQVAATAPEGLPAFAGEVEFQPNLPLVGLKAQLLYQKLGQLGEICYLDPPPEKLDELDELDRVRFGIASDQQLEKIKQQLQIGGVKAVAVEPLAVEQPEVSVTRAVSPARQPCAATAPTGPQEPAEAASSLAGAASSAAGASRMEAERPTGKAIQEKQVATDGGLRPAETLRVDIGRLDRLMNLSGQLVINKARFSQIGDNLKEAASSRQSMQAFNRISLNLQKMAAGNGAGGKHQDWEAELETLRSHARRMQDDLETVRGDINAMATVRTSMSDFFETVDQLNLVSDGIHQSVMDTRMLPIGPLFMRLKRVVRDIMRSNGKNIRMVINGDKTELDKRMIDELADPLIHMIRNSADHGIELPEAREAAGKPRQGTVTLDAFHLGNSIVIRVSDDGKGLDPDGIRRKAVDKGMITEADAEKMTHHQIRQLIWEPGLSTAEKVTEISGRGMGMDIVKSRIEELNGVVDLSSEQGKGTTLTIKLPLTLAILPSLIVDIGGDVFAMPLESVLEIIGVNKRDLATVYGQWTARVRDQVISMVKLDEIFTWTQQDTPTDAKHSEETTLVIIGERGCEIALAVDRVLGEGDIVIKSISENYRNVAGIAGASILGDGRISLILDVPALINMTSHQNTEAKQKKMENVVLSAQ